MQLSISNFRITPYKAPSFTASSIDDINKKVEGKNVFKNATKAQMGSFAIYLGTKNKDYNVGITPDEAQKLLKYDGDEFILNSYLYLTDKLGIPENVRPVLMPVDTLADSPLSMQYMPTDNIIMFDKDYVTKVDKIDIFTALRHELQHYKQNLQILRHEEYGEKALDAYTKNYVTMQKTLFEELYNNNEITELLKPGILPDQEDASLLYAYKHFKDSKLDLGLDLLFNHVGKKYKTELTEFRDKVIETYGVIKSDDIDSEKIERIYNEFNDLGYFNVNNEIDYDKYYSSFIEQDAIKAEYRAGFEFANEACFMQYMHNEQERILKNEFRRSHAKVINVHV